MKKNISQKRRAQEMSSITDEQAIQFCQEVYEELENTGKTGETTIDDIVSAIRTVQPKHKEVNILKTVDEREILEGLATLLEIASNIKNEKILKLATAITGIKAFPMLSQDARCITRISKEILTGGISDWHKFLIHVQEAMRSFIRDANKLDHESSKLIMDKLEGLTTTLMRVPTHAKEQKEQANDVWIELQGASSCVNELLPQMEKIPEYINDLKTGLSELEETFEIVASSEEPSLKVREIYS